MSLVARALAARGVVRLVAFGRSTSAHVQAFGRWPRRTLCGREVGWHRRAAPNDTSRLICRSCARALALLPVSRRAELAGGDGADPSPPASPDATPIPRPEHRRAPRPITTEETAT